jgi:SAM-dependent methyltransferase
VSPSLSELYTAFDSEPTRIVAFLRHLAESYRLPQPLRVLDVGCGPGRLLRPLERLRWEVTGMEPNPEFLASARAIATESRRIHVLPGGFQHIEDVEGFDLVLGVNSSFAHLLHPAERAGALQRIHRALRPGGVVFLDLPNFLWILKHGQAPPPFSSTLHGREVTLHRQHEIDYHEASVTTTDQYVFADGASATIELVHVYGITTLAEIETILAESDFVQVKTYNGYDSRATERLNGARMLVAAQRFRDWDDG